MELKCAVVFTLLSLLSVKANPHGHGVKGGALARAEAGAAAGAFSGVGLPLSIPSGPGFSGSFSKSSSSSFASSSASSSSSSFSFSGSGAGGYGLNSLGTSGSGECAGGCQSGQNVANGIKDSRESGSAGNGLLTFTGVKAQAAAGAYAGSPGELKNEVGCNNGVCSGQKTPCEGTNCKDGSESCKSGQCGSKSSETTLSDRDNEGCASGHCDIESESATDANSYNCKNGDCNGGNKKTSSVSSTNNNCASGHCVSGLPSSTATDNIPSNNKCTSGKCSDEPAPAAPGRDYESNDIPVSVSSTSTSSHNIDHHLSNGAKATTSTPQSGGTNCKYGNCGSLSQSPYGYSGSNTFNPNQPQTAAPGVGSSYKPATHLTAPKQDAACTHPNCNAPKPEEKPITPNLAPGQKDCARGNCENGPSIKYPAPNNEYSQPQNTYFPSGSPSSPCNTPNCYPGKDESKPDKSSQYPSSQKGNGYPSSNCASGNCDIPYNSNPSQPYVPEYTQGKLPSASGNCASGNCGHSTSYQPNHDNQLPKIPIYSQGSSTTTNCASGSCEKSPVPPTGTEKLNPTIPSHAPPLLCAFGPCDHKDHQTNFPYPRLPSYPQNIQPDRPPNCASGNCNFPSATSSTSSISSKFPFSTGPHLASGTSACTSGNCGSGSIPSSNCASGNCPNYISPELSNYPTGSKFPINSNQPSISSPSCVSGNCGSGHSYPHGSFSSSGFQNPTYSGVNPAVTLQPYPAQTGSNYPISQGEPEQSGPLSCTSGNCGFNPANQHGTPGYSGYPRPTYSDANPASSPQPKPVPTGSKYPIPQGHPPVSTSSDCTSGNCGSSPTYQHGSFDSGYQNPSYSDANPPVNCASGNCPKYPTTQPSSDPTGSKFLISHGKPSYSSSSGCASGSCGSNPVYQHGSFGLSGFQNPSYSNANSATYHTQSGVIASGSKLPSHTGSIGHVPSGSPYPSGSGSCTSGNCPSHPLTPPMSSSASNPSDKFPDYVALGVAGGTTKPTSTGLFMPGSGSVTSSGSGTTVGAHSQSSVISSANNDKDQAYTGGFGGPPGILKPYEFKTPVANTPSSNKNKDPHCSNGKCEGESGENISSNKHESLSHGSSQCASGNCGIQSGKPHQVQSNAVSGAFAGATATAGSDAAVYTGGFGGPPGVLQPYDDGKIGHSASISGVKHTAASGGHDSHAGGNTLNNAFGVLSGTTAMANAGAFGSGSFGGGYNKAGGCDSGCSASGQRSNDGGLLGRLHDGAKSISSAASTANASSFAVGGSFASSSASAHSVAGSATKGGYGR